jgi:hypothetical protein
MIDGHALVPYVQRLVLSGAGDFVTGNRSSAAALVAKDCVNIHINLIDFCVFVSAKRAG